MKSPWLLFLAGVLFCNLMMVCRAQGISAGEEPDSGTMDDLLLRGAESLLLRSVLRKMQAEDHNYGGLSSPSQAAWLTKRQHPGKRHREDVSDEGDAGDEAYSEVERRQHPGKRFATGRLSEPAVIVVQGDLSKRQHPGKRYVVVTRSRRQHPGKRQPDEEDEEEEEEEDEDNDDGGDEDLPELHRRQHPGKRFWDRPGMATVSPCEDLSDPVTCAKTNLLLDFLADVKHDEEKRQHPGKRFASNEGQ
ncbi:pro-thyrotropin-releasing hormone isoform X2 [Vanacampus margaritifer]